MSEGIAPSVNYYQM